MKAASEIGQVLIESDKKKQAIDDLHKYTNEPCVGLSFLLPKGTIIKELEDAKISTREETSLTFEFNANEMVFYFRPFLLIDVNLGIMRDLFLKNIQYHFKTMAVDLDLVYDDKIPGFAFISLDKAKTGIKEKIKKAVSGTPLETRKNYSPYTDPDLLNTFSKIIANVQKP